MEPLTSHEALLLSNSITALSAFRVESVWHQPDNFEKPEPGAHVAPPMPMQQSCKCITVIPALAKTPMVPAAAVFHLLHTA